MFASPNERGLAPTKSLSTKQMAAVKIANPEATPRSVCRSDLMTTRSGMKEKRDDCYPILKGVCIHGHKIHDIFKCFEDHVEVDLMHMSITIVKNCYFINKT